MKRFLLGFGVGVGILAVLLSRVDLTALGNALRGVRPAWLMAALAIKLTVMAVKAHRWALAIEGAGVPRPRHRVITACLIGFAGNVVMPARLGDLARSTVLRKHNAIPCSLSLTSAGITHIIDLIALVSLFAILSVQMAHELAVAPPVRLLIVAAPFILVAVAVITRGRVAEFQQRALLASEPPSQPDWKHWFSAVLDGLVAALGAMRRPVIVFRLMIWTLAVWSLEVVAAMCALTAFGIEVTFPMAALLLVASNLSFAIPLTPGNLGVHQLVSVLVLGWFGVGRAAALAYSVGMQGAMSILLVSIGLVLFYREGLSLTRLRDSSKLARTGVPAPTMEASIHVEHSTCRT